MKIKQKSLLCHRSKKEIDKSSLFSITFLSDSHINSSAVDDEAYPNASSPPMYFYTAREKLQQFINQSNIMLPDVAIHLGDIIDGPNADTSFEMGMQYWNMLDSNISKHISPGNHDAPGWGMETVAQTLGYGSREIVAGSKFNESFALSSKGIYIRFIGYDSNLALDGSYQGASKTYMSDTLMAWIESELLNSPEDLIFIYTHRASASYIQEPGWTNFKNMLESVVRQRPELNINIVYGHSHVPSIIKYTYLNVGKVVPMYNISALVDNTESEFYTFYVSKDGIEEIDTHWTKYESNT